MVEKLTIPKTEQEFRDLQDSLYSLTKNSIENGNEVSFKGFIEVASSEVVMTNAIHKIKANKGSKTPGIDGKTIKDILTLSTKELKDYIGRMFYRYNPDMVRRVHIPKGNGKTRPLGIPTIADRIVQECVKQTIEPIFEAQFFAHSYGFRPMRDTKHAIERIVFLMNRSNNYWAVEADIKGFFDNVDHNILIRQMWNMGIKDKRLLMMIKAMLKAGVMDEIKVNPMGTPQGGIISPLLANIYLHRMDTWISRHWEEKQLRNGTTNRIARLSSLRNYSSISKPEFLIRYADDFIIFTNSKTNAEKWKYKVGKYLKDNMKLELSQDKTHITDMTKKPIKFLGFRVKRSPRGKNKKMIGYSRPDLDKLDDKFIRLKGEIRKLKWCSNREWLVNDINLINSKLRGIINYYDASPSINEDMRKWRENLKYTCYKSIKKHGAQWIPTNECVNLQGFYKDRTEAIPAIKYREKWIGIISLSFATWKKKPMKNQNETPYTEEGRELFEKRTKKRPLIARVQSLMEDTGYATIVAGGSKNPIYNFEYFMNRCYAFNRDKGRCKICGVWLDNKDVETHHLKSTLPIDEVNRVPNLVSLCRVCHHLVHRKEMEKEHTKHLEIRQIKKLEKYRSIITANKLQELN